MTNNNLSFKFGELTSLLDSSVEKTINNGDFLLASYSNEDDNGVEKFGSSLYFGYNDTFIPITHTPGLENLPLVGTGLSNVPKYSSKFTTSELFFAHNDSLTVKAGGLFVNQAASATVAGETLLELGDSLNYFGTLRLFGPSGNFMNVQSRDTVSANSTFYLPNPLSRTKNGDNGTLDAYAIWHEKQASSTGDESVPVYIDADGCAKPINVLGVDFGGTGCSDQYAERLIFTDENRCLTSGPDELTGHTVTQYEMIIGEGVYSNADWYIEGQYYSNYPYILGVNGGILVNDVYGGETAFGIACPTASEDSPIAWINLKTPDLTDVEQIDWPVKQIRIPYLDGIMSVMTTASVSSDKTLSFVFSDGEYNGQIYELYNDGIRLKIKKTQVNKGIIGSGTMSLGIINPFIASTLNQRQSGGIEMLDGLNHAIKILPAKNPGRYDLDIEEGATLLFGTHLQRDENGIVSLKGSVKTIQFASSNSSNYINYTTLVKRKYIQDTSTKKIYYCYYDTTEGHLYYYDYDEDLSTSTLFLPPKQDEFKEYYAVWSATNNSDIGSNISPVYVNAYGQILPCKQYAGGTQLTVNDESYESKDVSIYAPIAFGLEGEVLLSQGYDNHTPIWVNQNTLKVLSAMQDSSDNVFEEHYSTKAEAENNLAIAKAYTDALGESLTGTTSELLDALKDLVESGDDSLIGSINSLSSDKANKTVTISTGQGLQINGNNTLADNITISGVVANITTPGIISIENQSFAGIKSFTDGISLSTNFVLSSNLYSTSNPEDVYKGTTRSLQQGQIYFKILPDEE